MLEKNSDTVKLVFKNYPLRNHQFALDAAVAALAADSQGKFWQFHDALFKAYNKLSKEKIDEIAGTLALDQDQFEKQRRNPKVFGLIRRDVQEAYQLGLRGVPSVFINGRRIKDRSMEGLQAVIDKELKLQNTKQQ